VVSKKRGRPPKTHRAGDCTYPCRECGEAPLTVAASVVTHTASLEHPSKPRCYVFNKLVGGAYRVERWEGGRETSTRLLESREKANDLWKYLRHQHGYAEFGWMSRQGGRRG
jgi:hypothetical protein